MMEEIETASNFVNIMTYGSIFILVFTASTMYLRKREKERN